MPGPRNYLLPTTWGRNVATVQPCGGIKTRLFIVSFDNKIYLDYLGARTFIPHQLTPYDWCTLYTVLSNLHPGGSSWPPFSLYSLQRLLQANQMAQEFMQTSWPKWFDFHDDAFFTRTKSSEGIVYRVYCMHVLPSVQCTVYSVQCIHVRLSEPIHPLDCLCARKWHTDIQGWKEKVMSGR